MSGPYARLRDKHAAEARGRSSARRLVRPNLSTAVLLSSLDVAWQREVREISEPLYRRPAALALRSAAVQIAQAFTREGMIDDAQCVLTWLDERETVGGSIIGRSV